MGCIRFWALRGSMCGFLMFFVAVSCTKQSGFEGASKKLTKFPPKQEDANAAPTFSGEIPEALSSIAKRDIWFVSSAARVERFSIKNAAATQDEEIWGSTGSWQLAGGASGHRTYVSEVGLVVAETGTGNMYRIGDDTPVGSTVQPVFKATGLDQNHLSVNGSDYQSRFCLTSYRSGGKSYVGGGYVKAGRKLAFVSIPIDKSKPNMLDTGAAVETILGDGIWGYSCFTDQSRNVFWSKFYITDPVAGINLDTKTAVSASDKAPNGKFAAASMTNFSLAATNLGSYALAGDPFGNLLSSNAMYTYAYDPISKMVFGTSIGLDKFTVTRVECFASKADCKLGVDHWVWDQAALGLKIGPMSSLNDGRIVGVSRGGNSDIWLLRLKDPKDPSQGPVAKKIAQAVGDGYMYTDFTGATLYAADVEKSVDLLTQPESPSKFVFVSGKAVKSLKMKWNAESGLPEEWRGLKLGIRCYAKSVVEKPPYVEVVAVPPAGVEFAVDAAGCSNAVFDTVEIHLAPSDAIGGFTKTRSFVFSGVQ